VEVVSARKKSKKRGREGVAVAAHQTAEPVVVMVESVEHGPFEESYLEIRRRKGKEVRLVASIEILSLSNKSNRQGGRTCVDPDQRVLPFLRIFCKRIWDH